MNSNEPIVLETKVTENEAAYAVSDIVTLRVRTETGKRTLIVKLSITDKIKAVYDAVRPYIES